MSLFDGGVLVGRIRWGCVPLMVERRHREQRGGRLVGLDCLVLLPSLLRCVLVIPAVKT